ncbi:membrane protein insertion efficiency factor YidD, partial [Vibrio parahaemolyticus]
MEARGSDYYPWALSLLKYISLKLIHRYQASGGSKQLLNIECNFEPTCSEYTKQCIAKYG